MTSMQRAALQVLSARLNAQHLMRSGVTQRRSEADHLIEMLRQAANSEVAKPC
jgi:hypothetical protein